MTSVATLIAWAMGRPVPDGPLCGCGRAAAMVDDGAELCWPCLYRRADLAANPNRFEAQVLVAADELHGDVVALATNDVLVDRHVHQTFMGVLVHAHYRRELVWRWTDAWPTDDRTLEDILETAALEQLWARSPRAAA